MEQNKVLMVIVSVVIFFAAIVGVGMALLYPRGDETALAASGSVVREFDPIEYVRSPDSGEMEESEDDDSDEVVIVYGDLPEQSAEDGDSQDRTIVEERMDDGPAEVTITERPARTPRTAESNDSSDTSDRPTTESGDTETDGAVAARESRQQPPPSRVEPQQPQREAPAESTPQPRQIRVTEYWIQLISSPNRDRVNQARTTLTDYSLGGRVTTRDIEGELYYRLRVGPYNSHAEAEKFLEWIRDIEGFSEAYISEEYPLRTVRS